MLAEIGIGWLGMIFVNPRRKEDWDLSPFLISLGPSLLNCCGFSELRTLYGLISCGISTVKK